MRTLLPFAATLAAACGGSMAPSPSPLGPLALGDSVVAVDAADGTPLSESALLDRLAAADFVLLGEVHDNPAHHAVRGRIIAALAKRRPAVVFEQFTERRSAIPGPEAGETLETWLDRHGFDRAGWKWPLHRPVVQAAVTDARSLWGSNLSRESLRSVVQQGEAALPEHLGRLVRRVPLDSAARAIMDRELVEGHCGRLPATMVPGMRAAQQARDAAMTSALLDAAADGPAWLIAGNGHVRRDVAVPRLLSAVAPGKRVVAVGLLERGADGSPPAAEALEAYDLVLVTPRVARPDPCAGT